MRTQETIEDLFKKFGLGTEKEREQFQFSALHQSINTNKNVKLEIVTSSCSLANKSKAGE